MRAATLPRDPCRHMEMTLTKLRQNRPSAGGSRLAFRNASAAAHRVVGGSAMEVEPGDGLLGSDAD